MERAARVVEHRLPRSVLRVVERASDPSSSIVDPFGHVWLLATRREELAPDEIVRRFHAAMSQGEIT